MRRGRRPVWCQATGPAQKVRSDPTPRAEKIVKRDVLEELGEPTVLLAALINAALAANDRTKYLLSLLQAARARADAASQPYSSLREERLAAGSRRSGLR
jgi:hypothetical protein